VTSHTFARNALLLTALHLLVAGAAPPAAGQIDTRRLLSQRVLSLEGSRAPRPLVEEAERFERTPRPLTTDQKAEILRSWGVLSAPGTVLWRLSAADPRSGRGALVLVNPYLVNAAADFMQWVVVPASSPETLKLRYGTGDKMLGLWLRSEGAGRRYLLDCAVAKTALLGPTTLKLTSPGGGTTSWTLGEGDQHVTWVMQASDDGWYDFQLRGDRSWRLHWCEATRL